VSRLRPESVPASRMWAAGGRDLVWRSAAVRPAAYLALLVLACLMPVLLTPFWLQTALFALIAAIGALSLNILMGSAGILAISPSFFFAVGAYAYAILGSPSEDKFGIALYGVGLPTPIALVLAVAITGIVGWLLSPLARRLRELPLAVASIGLIFLALHVMDNATKLTGGSLGRAVRRFSLFRYDFSSITSLYFLALFFLVLTWWYIANLLRSRPGRALEALRDSEIAASALGIDVEHYKQRVFVVSGAIGGLCGVLTALAFRHTIPDYFGFFLSVNFLAMIVIGGLGSPVGAVAGALFVTFLPQFIVEWGTWLPLLSTQGIGSGFTAQEASQIVFGVAIALFLLFQPRGIVGLSRAVAESAAGIVTARRAAAAAGSANATTEA